MDPSPVPLLDEQALRRPDFLGGRGVVLADGQTWIIPCPEVDLTPKILDDESLDVEVQTTFGPDFDRLVAAVPAAANHREEAGALIRLAADLLRRNYAIPAADLNRLLRYRVRDAERNDYLTTIYLIAIGVAPKAEPAGSASA